jgi:leader peptidase (prepilin peptidase)/N-methyltransferase
MGLLGLLAGGGVTQFVRVFGSTLLRREAMGFGDVTLMGMIGAFLGWQAAIMTFFLGAFFGLAHAVWKLALYLKKWLRGGKLSSADRELPFGPYLSMGAAALVLSWRWLWIESGPAREMFGTFRWFFWWMLGVNVGPNCPRCW